MPARIRLLMNDDYKVTAQELFKNRGYQLHFFEKDASCDCLHHLICLHAINGVFLNRHTEMKQLPLFEVLTLRAIGTLLPTAENVDRAKAYAHAVRVFAPDLSDARPEIQQVLLNAVAYLGSQECLVRRESLYPKRRRSFVVNDRFDIGMVYAAYRPSALD